MVLHRSNFEIPAQFIFQPFSAAWRIVSAETLEWVEDQRLMQAFVEPAKKPEKNRIRLRFEVPDDIEPTAAMLDLDAKRYDRVTLSRADLPPDVLAKHENHRNTPDISGRVFQLLICATEIEGYIPAVRPGVPKKNAWIMRDEFLSLPRDEDSNWNLSLCRFLSKWGLWGAGQQFSEGTLGKAYPNLSLLAGLPLYRREVVCLPPHLVREQHKKYSNGLLPSSRRHWLRSHPMSLQTVDDPPFFHLRRSYCTDAIETTITIDHLAERQFGICKRCHAVFEKETQHKKDYCSRACINAANVQRWREEQRKSQQKGAKRNAKS